ncbi:ABC transporter transmembrane domain-containing protein [Cellulosilyticum ruminicola]|uniref:ABC transporter transmembrane domain-containing protein n=1 Tax=Cellulosilyticum ruminicola TaxID=425254 RepID=UPI0006D1B4C6|nr:ABC transporter ATP-binding protein [Cellulosilyticum ruminicola]
MISRIWSLTAKYRGKFIVGIIFYYIYMLLNAVLPSLTKEIIDSGLNNLDIDKFQKLLLVGVIVIGILCITSLGSNYILIRQYQNIKTDVKSRMYHNILDANYGFLTSQNEGQITFRILNDTNCIDKLLEITFMAFPGDIISVTILFMAALAWDVKLSIFMIVVSIIQVAVTKVLRDKTVDTYKKQQIQTQQLSGGLTESIGNVILLKGINMKNFVINKINSMFNQVKDINIKYCYISVVGGLSTSLINSIWTLIILWYGVILVMRGEITVGVIMGFIMVSQAITPKLSSLFTNIINFNALKISFERVFEYYDVTSGIQGGTTSEVTSIQEGKIEANHIGFSYDNVNKIINDINFTIEPNKITAIIGKNGCGKSTLCMILKRFFPLQEGEILIDGVSINEINIEEFNKKVFYQHKINF